MKKIFISGAAGFIGSHLSEFLYKKFTHANFILLDKLTYASNKQYLKSILKSKRVSFIRDDIINFNVLIKLLKNVDLAINMAAESHVDNSFGNSLLFTKTNTLGTHSFLESCRINKVKKIIHVSTDEVYGESKNIAFSEDQFLNPTNPYSASKAGADMIANSYIHSYKMPINIIRANNIFGTRQYPEKLISKTIFNFLSKKKMTIHGNGDYYRHYLAVEDFCESIYTIILKGKKFEIYNVGSEDCYKITDVIKLIANNLNINYNKNICFVKNRPFNDKIYKINCKKLKKLQWHPKLQLRDKIHQLCDWYKKNINLFT
jgi:nucleoside-diphosphate-sugar epimerase